MEIIGQDYEIIRKNTFLELVPKGLGSPRGRPRARSLPAWSRETTPTRKQLESMEDRSTDIGSDRSPIGTPTMNTRGLNTQPMQWQPSFFWQPCFVEGENGSEQQPPSNNWNGQYENNQMYNGDFNGWVQNNQFGNMQFQYGEDGQYLMMDDMQMNSGEQIQNQGWEMHDGYMHDRRDGRMWEGRGVMGPRSAAMGPGKRKPRTHGKNNGGAKVFVGGLASKTTEDTLLKIFSQYGNVVHASVLVDATSRRSRGFGYVTFQGEVPEGVIDKDHLIDGRMCGARLYKYN